MHQRKLTFGASGDVAMVSAASAAIVSNETAQSHWVAICALQCEYFLHGSRNSGILRCGRDVGCERCRMRGVLSGRRRSFSVLQFGIPATRPLSRSLLMTGQYRNHSARCSICLTATKSKRHFSDRRMGSRSSRPWQTKLPLGATRSEITLTRIRRSRCCRGSALPDELAQCDDAIESATAQKPRWMRPPFGFRSPLLDGILRRRGGAGLVMWSAWARDWKAQPTGPVIERLRRAQGGDIVLLHDGDHRVINSDRRHTIAALEYWLPRWKDSGIRFVTLDEMQQQRQSGKI